MSASVTVRRARAARHERVRRKVSGTAKRPRLAVYRSLAHIHAQLVDDVARRTLAAASSLELRGTTGKTKSEIAALVGERLGERAKTAGISAAVFDRGGFRYHGRVRALAEGARKTGLAL